MLLLMFALMVFSTGNCELKFSSDQITLEVGKSEIINFTGENANATYTFLTENNAIQVLSNDSICKYICNIHLQAHKPGKSGLTATILKGERVENIFLPIKVHRSEILEYFSITIGWCYFLTWSVSFYPQIYSNYKRKSVVGLHFDFISFNIVGYVMYNVFNWGVYFIPLIKKQYSIRHPKGINPIRTNDILFSTHSFFATIVTLTQCCIYKSANQKVSATAKIIIGIYVAVISLTVVLALSEVIWWLDFLYLCSYIKLSATLKKYTPQAYMNYKRKSTKGWSIGSVTLDFVGGILSIFQMVLDGYNYDDWNIFYENPTKFGLGLLSDCFCLTFLIQHYILYSDEKPKDDIKIDTIIPEEICCSTKQEKF